MNLSWVLVHADYPEARAHVLMAESDGDAKASRPTVAGTHKDIDDRIRVVLRMDDPKMKAAIMKAAGL